MHRASIRALKHRKEYLAKQSARSVFKYLRINYCITKPNKRVRRVLSRYTTKSNLKCKSRIKDACIITGRSKGVTRVNLSRMQIRKFVAMGCIQGLKKYYW